MQLPPKTHVWWSNCIVHQENVCTKALKMNNIMQIIIKTMNFMRAKGLHLHQFKEFLKSTDADYGDVIYFLDVSWLSWGQILKRFYDVWHVIKSFMVSKNKFVPELDDENWLTDLAFLVDLTAPLSELNMSSRWKPAYQYHVSNHISTPNETEMWQAHIRTVLCTSTCRLSTVLWTVKNMQPCFQFDTGIWKQISGFPRK